MTRRMTAVLLCALALTTAAQAQDVLVPLGPEEGWAALPGWTPLTAAREYSHTVEDGIAVFRASGGGGTMIWIRSLADLGDLSDMRFVSLRYRVSDIDPQLISYFLYADAGDERAFSGRNILLGAPDLIVDGQWHIAVVPIDLGAPIARLGIRFAALSGREGRVEIEWLRLSARRPRFPLAQTLSWQATAPPARPISLQGLRNLDLDGVQEGLALADWFDTPAVEIAGARFVVPTEGAIALMTSKTEDSVTEIPVGAATGEVHLLMGGDFFPKLLTYRNWENGDRIWLPTQFLITLHYADGTAVEQMPYCVDLGDYGVWRGLHVYALTADPAKVLERLTLYDGATRNAFVLVAATAAEPGLMPALPGAARVTPAGTPPLARAPRIETRDELLVAANSGGALSFDPRAGCALSFIENARHPGVPFTADATTSLFAVSEEFTTWEGRDFAEVERTVADGVATIVYRSDDARAEVRLTITPLEGDEVRLDFAVRNLADGPRRLDLILPRVTLSCPDPWYLYPAMGVAWSNRDRVLRRSHDGFFPVQFMDVYDRSAGGGLYLMTRDREGLERRYALVKDGPQTTQAVEYTYQNFAAGESRVFPSAWVGVHGGDWRPAWDAYRAWLTTWQQPMVPRNEWFRRVWNFRTSWVQHFPGETWRDPETGRYRTEEMLAKDTELFGPVDMNHFFDWRISEQYGRWGDYDHYDELGGLDAFRGMIAYQQEHGTRVGLYLDTYLCSKKSLIGQAHGEEWAVQRADGSYPGGYSTPEDPQWNMCVWHPGWREYLARRCADVVAETGVDGVYLDEGGIDYGAYWCWRDDHPHQVPGCDQTGFLELCRETRAQLPPSAVLYTEHAPADIVIPYIDGGYMVALGKGDWEITPGFVHVHRFAFPDFKLLPITSGGSLSCGIWDGLRYSMFNGAAIYSLAWGHEEEAFALIRKINSVLRGHEDAFLTSAPEMFVPTLAEEIYCNRFPGERETVWTLWNGRWQSFAGPVLRIPHVEGATYRDLWADRELTPRLEGGFAVIEQSLGARNIGVVAQITG